MKKTRIIPAVVLAVTVMAGSTFAMNPVAVSPGSDSGAAVIGQICPSFSWSEVSGAAAYKIEVFEAETIDVYSYDVMAVTSEPVVSVTIPAPALSWTPSADNCLISDNAYVWYVRGTDANGEGEWSGGRVFEVDETVAIESLERRVEKAVEDYLVKERIRGDYSGTGSEKRNQDSDEEIIQAEKRAGDFLTSPYARFEGSEGTTNTFYGQGAGAGNSGSGNTFIGRSAGANNNGNDNTFVGHNAGLNNLGSGNVFLGYFAGGSTTTTSNKLFIDNTGGSAPLIYGEFDNNLLDINGRLNVRGDTGPLPAVSADTHAIVSNTSAGTDRAYLSIIAGGTTGISRINFGDTDQENVGFFSYSHSNNSMQVFAGNNEVMRFVNNKMAIGGEVSPDSTLSVKGNAAIGAGYSGSAAGPADGLIVQGNVGIGTANPQSTLQVGGYVQLALTSGPPPATDCDEASEWGRMKVDSSAGTLYVCVNTGWAAK